MPSFMKIADYFADLIKLAVADNGDGTVTPKVFPGAAYDAPNDMLKVQSMQKKWRDSFGGTALDANKWGIISQSGTLAVAAGVLTLGSGTAINGETSILSKETFTPPFRATIGMTLSQRIDNQTFLVEAVSVDPVTGIPDGLNTFALVFDGVSVTQAKYRVQNSGGTPLDSGASTFPTTTTGSIYELELFADEAWAHGGTIDSTNARANSYRRHQQIPDPNALYKLRIRWLNGGTAPASNSNAGVQFLAVQDYAELTAEITAGRGQASAGQSVGVNVTGGTVTVSGSLPPAVATGTGGLALPARLMASAATTNATLVKSTAGRLYRVRGRNAVASPRYLKFYNKTSAPTVGTDVPVFTAVLEPSAPFDIDFGTLGVVFTTGISYAVTGAVADNDTTAIAAADIIAMHTFYA